VLPFLLPFFGEYVNSVLSITKVRVDVLVTPPPPRTMTVEWQEATNERLKELGIEPISGPASDNYQVFESLFSIFSNRM
jgi:Cytochrome c oxidase subunit IV